MFKGIKYTIFAAVLAASKVTMIEDASIENCEISFIKDEIIKDELLDEGIILLSDVEVLDRYKVYYKESDSLFEIGGKIYFESYSDDVKLDFSQYSKINNKIADLKSKDLTKHKFVNGIYITDPYSIFDFTKVRMPDYGVGGLSIVSSGDNFSLDGLSDDYYSINIFDTRIDPATCPDFFKFSDLSDCNLDIYTDAGRCDNYGYDNMDLLKILAESGKEIEGIDVLFGNTDRTQMFLSFVNDIKATTIEIQDRFPDEFLNYSIVLNDLTESISITECDQTFFDLIPPMVAKFEVSGKNLRYLDFEGCENLEIKKVFYDYEEKRFDYQLNLEKIDEYQKSLGSKYNIKNIPY